jgi:hypothetical protein
MNDCNFSNAVKDGLNNWGRVSKGSRRTRNRKVNTNSLLWVGLWFLYEISSWKDGAFLLCLAIDIVCFYTLLE